MALLIGEYANRFPDDLEVLTRHSKLLLERGYFREAMLLANSIISRDSNKSKAWHTSAMARAEMWQFSSSLNDLEEYCKMKGVEPELNADYRNIKVMEQIHGLIQDTDRSISNAPDSAALYRERADLLLKMNRPLAARADYRYLFELQYNEQDFIFNLLRSGFLLEEFPEAQKDLEVFQKRYPDHSMTGLELFESLIRSAVKLENNKPSETDYLVEMARIYASAQLETKAISYLQRALQSDPGNLNIKYRMAVVYLMKKELKTARRLARELQEAGFNLPDQFTEQIK